MADFAKGELVRHGQFGIGRVEEKADGPDREVYFPRLDITKISDLIHR